MLLNKFKGKVFQIERGVFAIYEGKTFSYIQNKTVYKYRIEDTRKK